MDVRAVHDAPPQLIRRQEEFLGEYVGLRLAAFLGGIGDDAFRTGLERGAARTLPPSNGSCRLARRAATSDRSRAR